MASTLTSLADSPGGGSRSPVKALGGRAVDIAEYKIAFGNPYVVGGEDISAIWNDFKDVLAIVPSQVEATIADRREFMVVLATKKLIMLTAFNTESTAIDQTAVADVRLLVFGYR